MYYIRKFYKIEHTNYFYKKGDIMMHFKRKLIQNRQSLLINIPVDIIKYIGLNNDHTAKIKVINEKTVEIVFEVDDDESTIWLLYRWWYK